MLPNISVSWLTSCWKTSYSKRLASTFWHQRVSASAVLLELSNDLWYQEYKDWDDKHHYRLRKKASDLNIKRELDNRLDKIVDETIGDHLIYWRLIIAETLTAPLIYGEKMENVLKIYFDVWLETRAKRAFVSSDIFDFNELVEKVHGKDVISQRLIKNLWNVDIFDRQLLYDKHDVVIDNSCFDEMRDKRIIQKEKECIQDLLRSLVIIHQKKQHVAVLEGDFQKAMWIIEKHNFLIKKSSLLDR